MGSKSNALRFFIEMDRRDSSFQSQRATANAMLMLKINAIHALFL